MEYKNNTNNFGNRLINKFKELWTIIINRAKAPRLPEPKADIKQEKSKQTARQTFAAGLAVGIAATTIGGQILAKTEIEEKENEKIISTTDTHDKLEVPKRENSKTPSSDIALDNFLEQLVPSEEQLTESEETVVIEETDLYNVISQYGLNLRETPTTEEDNKICIINTGDFVYAYPSTIKKQADGRTWGKVDYYNEETQENYTGYISMGNTQVKKLNKQLFGYEEIEITDEDIEKMVKFTHSWENQALYGYLQGCKGYSYTSKYINGAITEDGKYYKCHGDGIDNGALNYGFGVMVSLQGYANSHVVEYFKELGYDITDERYLVIGSEKSVLPVKVVDTVSAKFMEETIKSIKERLQEKNIKFTKNELLGLTGICYQFGKDKIFVDRFLDSYIANNGNTEEFKANFKTKGGTYLFQEVNGGEIKYDGELRNRAYAYWKSFHEGIFIMGSGNEKEITFGEPDKPVEETIIEETKPNPPISYRSSIENHLDDR